jgi:amino acid permease
MICLSDCFSERSDTDITSTEFVALNNFQMLVDGGTAGMFWSYTWVIFGQFFIVLSLAEMSSMAPTAGGYSSLYPISISTS